MQSSLYQRGRAYSWGQWTVELHKRVWEKGGQKKPENWNAIREEQDTHKNHAYAIRRTDIYSDLRKKRIKEITKTGSQKSGHNNCTTKMGMQTRPYTTNAWIHCSPFLSPENSQVTRGKFIDRSLHPTSKEKEGARLLDMVPVKKGFQTFLQDWKRFWPLLYGCSSLHSPGWEKTWVTRVLGG